MAQAFAEGQRRLQDRFDTRRLADHLYAKLVRDTINPKQKAFIESADMFFLASADDQGRPTCSYKGGDPGFVRVVDDRTLATPNYDGDGKYLSWGNVLNNPNVALLFLDFMKGWRLRVHGTAEVRHDDPLIELWPQSQFVVRIAVREVFGNCPRYIHKYQLVERSIYVPRSAAPTPVPEWKKLADMNQVLAANDPARLPPESQSM
ncbi:MAG TPA: pyridoxamine 5'-phosphate oxidase family protein [Tepidisphaeraceae bacterium]|nr:pyridoxamine 5'-phosphate oxidase family protein [Tepidisphaeraceae bacterium]